jgi:hypothetical protein
MTAKAQRSGSITLQGLCQCGRDYLNRPTIIGRNQLYIDLQSVAFWLLEHGDEAGFRTWLTLAGIDEWTEAYQQQLEALAPAVFRMVARLDAAP